MKEKSKEGGIQWMKIWCFCLKLAACFKLLLEDSRGKYRLHCIDWKPIFFVMDGDNWQDPKTPPPTFSFKLILLIFQTSMLKVQTLWTPDADKGPSSLFWRVNVLSHWPASRLLTVIICFYFTQLAIGHTFCNYSFKFYLLP